MDRYLQISQAAYALWLKHGCPEGTAEADWRAAEQWFDALAPPDLIATDADARKEEVGDLSVAK